MYSDGKKDIGMVDNYRVTEHGIMEIRKLKEE
jgi:hypothetical protein